MNQLLKFIGNIESRLKRLEENIGSATDTIINFMSIDEEIGISDSLNIYKRDVNDSFLVGTSKIGIDKIGDRRGTSTLLYSSE